jgi:phenylpyruvate tautomerase PptA (4-oxalocrotonate tautomerase family)
MSSLLCRKFDPYSGDRVRKRMYQNVKTGMNVVVAVQETRPRSWGSCEHASYLNTGINVVVAVQETRPRSWGSCALVSYVKTRLNVVVAVQETRPRFWGSCAFSSPLT